MKKIIFIGNSSATLTAIEEIRRNDKDSEIAVFTCENTMAAKRHLFGGIISGKISESDAMYGASNFYEENSVNVISDKKIIRIDCKNRRITTEDKERFTYNVLIVADMPCAQFPDIKGTGKQGVFSIHSFDKIKDICGQLPIFETVSLHADNISGLNIACALKERNKEVIFVTPSDFILSHILDREPSEILADHLVENGIRIITDNDIAEILGDSDIKAIKLKSGKVIATQALLFDGRYPDFKLFKDTGIEMRSGLIVDECLRTNIEEVFAFDRACEPKDAASTVDDFEISLLELQEQGKALGSTIAGQSAAYSKPFRVIEMDFFGLSLVLIGETKTGKGSACISHSDDTNKIYRKFIFKDNLLAGAVLVNANDQKEKFIKLARESVSFNEVRKHIFESSDTEELISGNGSADISENACGACTITSDVASSEDHHKEFIQGEEENNLNIHLNDGLSI